MADIGEAPTILVTGGASGIGRAVIEKFAADGFTAVSLDLEPCEAASHSVCGDVREPMMHASAVAWALEATGRLDVLVANAGVHDGGVDLDAAPEDLRERMRRVLDVDVIGYVLAVQAAAPALRQAAGDVVFTLSDASFLVGQQGAGVAYTTAKHAARGMLGWVAKELAPEVRVNAIAPGGVVTGLRTVGGAGEPERAVFEDAEAEKARVKARNPMQTVLSAEEVARYYRWIVSDDAPGLTGQIVRPDGGLVIR